MSSSDKVQPWCIRVATVCAFLVPGIGLWVPSGYSFGVSLLLLAALLSVPFWSRRVRPLGLTGWLALSIAVMGVLWWVDAEPSQFGPGAYEKPLKYLLALPCLFFLHAYAPRPQALWFGFAIGGIGSGLTGIYQSVVQHMPRSTGYTNAIQYGDLSLLFGLICLVFLAARPSCMRRPLHLLLAAGAALGVLGCLMSQSRGGWLALLIVLPVMAILLARYLPRRAMLVVGLLSLAGIVIMVAAQVRTFDERIDEAQHEIALFNKGDSTVTSVGQRLYHWQLAWQMGIEKPLTGWGRRGYEMEKKRRVEVGLANSSVLDYAHAHNEVLDIFVKHGVPGVLALFLFYGVPIFLFWPSAARMRHGPDGSVDRIALGLRMAGLLIPICTIGFGLTQVFTAHNSGNINYLFLTMLLYACLRGHEREQAEARTMPTSSQGVSVDARPAGQ